MNEKFHSERAAIAHRMFAGPCSCGPAVHINLEHASGEIFATCMLNLGECDVLIKQIRASAKAIRKAAQ